ncbi:MAG: AAA family ATPase [Endomicrobium sp.]|jgi:putative ATP-dependent endonuclease of OLD family|nr:AAA family ATPase [Endomicrobium sp.]
MYISEIKIANFRIFKQLELKLNKGLNVFVGENNSGKTAILDAIKYVLDTNSTDYLNIDRENDFHVDTNGNISDTFSIKLTFSDLNRSNEATFLQYLTYEEVDGKLTPKLYLTLTCNKEDEGRKGYIRRHVRTGRDGDGKELDAVIKELLEVTYLKPLRDAEVELKASRASRLAKILEGYIDLPKEKFEDNSFDLFKKIDAFYEEMGRRIDSLKGEEKAISTKIKERYLNNLVVGEEKDINLGLKNKDNKTKYRDILSKLNLEYNDRKGKQGLGYQNILFMAVEMLLLEGEIYNHAPIMLIEEPEAHLHPQLQIKLLDFISKQEKESLQIFMTTHSPNLASKVPIKDLYLCSAQGVYPLRPEETMLDKEDYVFLEKFLDVTKADLFFAKGLILVEGISEQLLLPRMAELLSVDISKKGISIINIGNTAYEKFVKIFKRRSGSDIPLPIAYVTDLDIIEYFKEGDMEASLVEAERSSKLNVNSKYHQGFVSKYRTLEVDLIHKNREKVCQSIRRFITPQEEYEKATIKELFNYINDGKHKSHLAYHLVNLDLRKASLVHSFLNEKPDKSTFEETVFSLNLHESSSWTAKQKSTAENALLLSTSDIPDYINDAISFVDRKIS